MLLLSKQGDPPGTFLDRRQIDSGQIKVGRGSATCDWVLPDTSGHISREHCTISAIGLDLFVVDTSTNGVALNAPGQRIAPQQPVAVRVNDRLLLGDYVIEVATEAAGFGAQLQPAPLPGFDAPAAFQQPDAWFDQGAADLIWGTGASQAEVHDFLGNAMHDFLAPPASSSGGAAAFDPFAGGALGEAFRKPLLGEAIAPAEDAFAIPADWAVPVPSSAAASGGREAPPAAPASPPPADPFAGFDQPAASFAAADPFAGWEMPAPDEAPTPDPFVLPEPARGSTTAVHPIPPSADAPAPAPAAAAGSPDWGAFCEGAGLDPADLRTSPDAMRRLGVLYRQVVLGLSDLIQDRASFKDEFRVERTQLGFGRNNPLKYLPPLDTAKLLLAQPLPGFMDGDEAVRTALEDVKKHQLALLAGVQHALKAVFQRLSPAEVDRVMKKATAERRGISLRRGVDPWSVYQTMFEALRKDAASNVNSVMSLAFREGYEAFLKTA